MDTTTAAWRRIETLSSTVAFSPDGRTLASGHGNVVGLYDYGTGALQREYVLDADDHVIAVAFSPAGRLVFTKGTLDEIPQRAIYERVALCYTTNEGQLVRRDLDLYGLGSGIRKTEFSSDGSLLAVVGSNSKIALYDAATGNQRLVPTRAPPEPATPSSSPLGRPTEVPTDADGGECKQS